MINLAGRWGHRFTSIKVDDASTTRIASPALWLRRAKPASANAIASPHGRLPGKLL
jgi:hypothetical protein